MRLVLSALVVAVLTGTAVAQTAPADAPPGSATQQIMPTSTLMPSPTEGMDPSDDPFADGPIEQSFDAMGSTEAIPRIVLFDHADFTGRRIGLTEDDADLTDHSFNAVASSVRVYGGAWELCDEPNFNGHCEDVSGNTDLEASGFGDKVVSVRLEDR